MNTVPIEILHCILDYVAPMREADSRIACSRVCKLWRNVVKRVAKPIHDTITATHTACKNKHDRLLCWLIYSGYRVDNMDVLAILRAENMRLVRCLSKHCDKCIRTMLYGDDIPAMCTPRVVKYLLDKMNYHIYAGSMFVASVVARNFPVAEMLLKHYDPNGTLAAAACPLAIGCRKSVVTLDWALSQQCPCNTQEIIDQTRWMSVYKRIKLLRVLAKHYPADLLVEETLNTMGVFDDRIGSSFYSGAGIWPIYRLFRSEEAHTSFATELMGCRMRNRPQHVMLAHVENTRHLHQHRPIRKELSKHNSRRANSKRGPRNRCW